MERLKSALENLDQAIDMAESSLERRRKALDGIIEERATKRIKIATDTADKAVHQSRQTEAAALERVAKQHDLTNLVAGRLDQVIMRIGKLTGQESVS